MKTSKKYSFILSIVCALYSVFLLAVPILTSQLVDLAVEVSKEESPELKPLYWAILWVVVVILVDVFLYALEQWLYFRFAVKREKQMKEELFYSIFQKEFAFVSKYHSAEIEQLFTTDIHNLLRKELDVIPAFVRQATRLVLAIGVVVYIDVWFLVLILVCGLIGFSLAKIYSKWIRPHHHNVLEQEGKFNGYIIESTSQMKLIQAYDAIKYSNIHFDQLNHNQLFAKRKRNRIFFLANSGVFAFSSILYLFALCYGAYGIATKVLTYGSMIALVQLLNNIQDPLLSFSSLWNQINLAKASRKRIEEIYQLANRENERGNLDFDDLVFEDVSFSYDDKEVLKHFSATIHKGDTILLKGPSGIGKTTLFMLLLGFLKPASGRIYLRYQGTEASVFSELFSYVPQEMLLFSGTIAENIFILTGASKEESVWALKLTNIYDEIMELPLGLDTVIKERGAGLSLGQIQRILIAIALLKDRPILLLDEFSSALDQKNEEEIMEKISKLGKTILYISHRTKTMPDHKVVELRGE